VAPRRIQPTDGCHRQIRFRNLQHDEGRRRHQSGRHPPAKPALDRRRERLLASALAAPEGTPKRLLLPPKATDDSRRHRIPRWFSEANDNNRLVKEGRQVETSSPRVRLKPPWTKPRDGADSYHAWTDGSFRGAAGLSWLITTDNKGEGPVIAEGARNLGGQQTAFDMEVATIEQAVKWFLTSNRDHRHMTIHSDSTSAISRAGHTGPDYRSEHQKYGLRTSGPGQNGQPRMGQGPPGDTWQRESGRTGRKGC
jgi:hypothetical protein